MKLAIRFGVKVFDSKNHEKSVHSIMNLLKNHHLWLSGLRHEENEAQPEDVYESLKSNHCIEFETSSEERFLRAYFLDSILTVKVRYNDADIATPTAFISNVTSFFEELLESNDCDYELLDCCGLENESLNFPRLKPPKETGAFFCDYAINVFTPKNINLHFMERETAFRRICESPLPNDAAVERTVEIDKYLIVIWVKELLSKEAWRKASETHRRWINRIIEPPILDGYNKLGDERIFLHDAEKGRDVTFYSASTHAAYQTFLDFDGHLSDTKKWNKLKQWKAEGFLPKGLPLEKVYLITSSREKAIGMKNAADEAGFDSVYYPDNEGSFWDPFPSGSWIENP